MRRVWAAISKQPNARTRDLARELGCCASVVCTSLQRLRQLGYVDYDDRAKGARIVLVPFGESML